MPQGTVKWFNPRKGFGFITSEDGTEIFVHKSDVDYLGHRNQLAEGLKVTYEVEKSPKGQKAIKVRTPDAATF
ncbi:cold shock domain-containing protein [candidate division KSB1 bacterium]|nr:cold shock domain-containing protein [candidate division KSB1 bacterium]TDI79219.1 MAG: cold shock domain-containing protein [Caldithrix sp.]TDI97202.1 MAG: cold shock domain-containing protein [Caldithrix sp.]